MPGWTELPGAQVRRQGSELILERNASDSGNLHVLWEIEGYGLLTLSTGTLIEREEPYYLPLELARGKIGQVRNQAAELSMLGLEVPQSVMERLAEATRQFSEAARFARLRLFGTSGRARVGTHGGRCLPAGRGLHRASARAYGAGPGTGSGP